MKDPILKELNKNRDDYAKKFNYSSEEIYKDLKLKEQKFKAEGWKVVSFEPKRPEKEAA